MAKEVEGAIEDLERKAAWQHEYILWLATQLTPGQCLDLQPVTYPTIFDYPEPPRSPRYCRRMFAFIQQSWDKRPGDPGLLKRIVLLLRSTGWEVTIRRREFIDSTRWHRPVSVFARKDGFELEVGTMRTAQQGYHLTIYSSSTPPVDLYEPTARVEPDPVKTLETVNPGYVLCDECDGLGWCPICWGWGWNLKRRDDGSLWPSRCLECIGGKVCPICGGDGERPIET